MNKEIDPTVYLLNPIPIWLYFAITVVSFGIFCHSLYDFYFPVSWVSAVAFLSFGCLTFVSWRVRKAVLRAEAERNGQD